MTVTEMLERFITSKRAAGVSDATVYWYRQMIVAFDTWLQQQANQALTPELMETYLVYLRDRHKLNGGKPLADMSIAGAARALKAFFKWAKAKKLIDESPMAEIRLMKPEAKEPRRAMRDEVDILFRSIPVNGWVGLRDYLVIHVAFFCGLRVGELILLEAHHFDIQQEVLHIPGGKSGGGLVPLLREVIEAFLAYQTHRPKCEETRLFVASDGHDRVAGVLTENGVRQMLRRRCKEAGVRHLNPHSMRHGLAMFLLNEKRVDASLVQRILRHANIKTTTTFYARWTQDAMADEFRRKMAR